MIVNRFIIRAVAAIALAILSSILQKPVYAQIQSEESFTRDSLFNHEDYFVSLDRRTWAEAETRCEEHFEGRGRLLCLETEDKLKFIVDEYLARQGSHKVSGSKFWTGAIFVRSEHNWRWSNGISVSQNPVVESSPKWGEGHDHIVDSNAFTSKTRLLLDYHSKSNFFLEVQDSNRPARYICERIRSPDEVLPTPVTTTQKTSKPTTPKTPRPTTPKAPRPTTPKTPRPTTPKTPRPTTPKTPKPTTRKTPKPTIPKTLTTPTPTNPTQCDQGSDLVIVLSHSCKYSHKYRVAQFAASMVAEEWKSKSRNNQVGFITINFDGNSLSKIPLRNSIPAIQIESAIKEKSTPKHIPMRSISKDINNAYMIYKAVKELRKSNRQSPQSILFVDGSDPKTNNPIKNENNISKVLLKALGIQLYEIETSNDAHQNYVTFSANRTSKKFVPNQHNFATMVRLMSPDSFC